MNEWIGEVIDPATGEVFGVGYDSPRVARDAADMYAESLRRVMVAVQVTPLGKFVSHTAQPPGEEEKDGG